MKYLLKYKLFEDHKETSDKIVEIENDYQKQKEDVINQYKELIDEMMYDITDDYHTESEINIKNVEPSLDRYVKTYVDYKIKFKISEYVDFFKKLKEVVERLRNTYEISYSISALYDIEPIRGQLSTITGRLNYKHHFIFDQVRQMIRSHIRDKYNNHAPDDVKIQIEISF